LVNPATRTTSFRLCRARSKPKTLALVDRHKVANLHNREWFTWSHSPAGALALGAFRAVRGALFHRPPSDCTIRHSHSTFGAAQMESACRQGSVLDKSSHTGVVSGWHQSGYRKFDAEIDQRRGQKDHPNATDNADLLLTGSCPAAGEHNCGRTRAIRPMMAGTATSINDIITPPSPPSLLGAPPATSSG